MAIYLRSRRALGSRVIGKHAWSSTDPHPRMYETQKPKCSFDYAGRSNPKFALKTAKVKLSRGLSRGGLRHLRHLRALAQHRPAGGRCNRHLEANCAIHGGKVPSGSPRACSESPVYHCDCTLLTASSDRANQVFLASECLLEFPKAILKLPHQENHKTDAKTALIAVLLCLLHN